MSDRPGEPGGQDPWGAWRDWSAGSGAGGGGNAGAGGGGGERGAGPWDAWKSWQWTPGQRPPMASSFGGSGCGPNAFGFIILIVIAIMIISSLLGSVAGGGDLPADDLIAAIDSLPVTGPRDRRAPDASAGESATFPAPGAEPAAVADQIQAVRAPRQRDTSGTSTFLLYEEATVAIQDVDGGSEIVVFEDNREASRRFPAILILPGWSGSLNDFDTRARSRGGIGGYRGGGGGLGK